MTKRLRIFISSPSDVTAERRRAALVIEKLAKDYARVFEVGFVLWETEPMLASGHFQDAIVPPSETDITVLILWSRLGSPLPERTPVREYRGIDGRVPVTGTEWEFESALSANRKSGVPDLLAYKKNVAPKAEYSSAADLEELGRQLGKLQEFWGKYFGAEGAAHKLFDDLDTFETTLENDLRRLIERRAEAIEGTGHGLPSATWLKGSPFRGLENYQFQHAPIFFGRSNAIKTAVDQLVQNAEAGNPFLLVLGASGTGKSSLVQAGIVPAIITRSVIPGVGEWRRALLRPGGHPGGPFAALAAALTSDECLPELAAGQDVASLARHLSAAAADPMYPITSALGARVKSGREDGRLASYETVKLVLVLDQFEELLTIGEFTAEQRNNFLRCVQAMLRSGDVFVIATMRSDYWHRAAEVPLLVELASGRGRLDLLRPTPSEIAEMIRRPAEAAGLTFEIDPRTEIRLDAALAEEAAQEPGALPLLSFLLDALYDHDIKEGGGRTLSYRSMRTLGGLKGAIAQRADAALARLPADVQAALPKLQRALVTVSRSGADPTAREAPISRLAEGSPERKIAEALLAPDMRLLVAEGDGERAVIHLAHEALITHWERARRQIAQDRDDLRTRAVVEEAEAEWRAAKAGQKRQYLLRDPRLANATDLARRWGDQLSSDLSTFIAQSDRAAKSATRRRWAVAAVIMFCLAAMATASVWGLYTAELQRNAVLVGQSRFLASDARTATAEGNATLATLLALAALPQNLGHPDRPLAPEAEFALEDSFANQRERFDLRGHTAPITDIAFSPDGTKAATASADNDAILWDARTGGRVVVLHGHDRALTSIAFSPDGTRVATAASDRSARVWDTAAGNQILALLGHERDVRSVSFSADGEHILTSSWDGTARIWNAGTGALVLILRGQNKPINYAEFSADGKRVVAAYESENAQIWDAQSGRSIAVLSGHTDRLTRATFSADGGRVVTASFDRTARIWDARTGAQIGILAGHEGRLNDARFSPDGRRIVTASDDRTARLWDAENGSLIAVLRHDKEVVFAAFSPDGSFLVSTADDNTAHLWDSQSGALVGVLAGHEKIVTEAIFSPDSRHVLTASGDNTARLWSVRTRAETATLTGHEAGIQSGAFAPDGARVVTASDDSTARIWDAKSDAVLAVLHGHEKNVISAVVSSDGSRVVTSSWDKTARLWDVASGGEIAVMRGHDDLVTSAVFSPDGNLAATASYDRTARIWDAHSGQQMRVLKGHENRVNSVMFSPDGRLVVTASDDRTARLWDISTGRTVAVLRGHGEAVKWAQFSPDGARVVTISDDKTARLWDARTGAQSALLQGHGEALVDASFSPDSLQVVTASRDKTARLWDSRTGALTAVLRGHTQELTAAEFSPTGKHVVTASLDATARLWDTGSGSQEAVLRGHEHAVTAVAFSPDGRQVLTTSDDKTARLWTIPPQCQVLIDVARQSVPRDLTAQERDRYYLIARSTGVFELSSMFRPLLALLISADDSACSR